jgi:hypothetical protein
MPRLSYFYGIAVYMYFRDHAPPHFHAVYGSFEAEVGIRSRRLLGGKLPTRALALVREWARMHEVELLAAWSNAQMDAPMEPIPPLG